MEVKQKKVFLKKNRKVEAPSLITGGAMPGTWRIFLPIPS
jgi:hypothetical protein